jgi:hypothetical protein
MTDSQTPRDQPLVDEEDVKAREREKLDIGDDHPQDRDIRRHERNPDEELDVGDPRRGHVPRRPRRRLLIPRDWHEIAACTPLDLSAEGA